MYTLFSFKCFVKLYQNMFFTVCRVIKQFVFIFSIKYFPNRVISSQASFDLSQKPKSDM